MASESFLKSITSSILWKGMDRLAGFSKHIIIAAMLGLSAQLDVFYMAMAMLGVFVCSWAGLFDVVAVPNMVKAWQENRQEEFRQISSGLFTFSLILSLFLAALLYFAKTGVAALAIGFDQDRNRLLAEAIPWLLPVILLYIPWRFMGSILRSIRSFSIFYQTEFLSTLSVLLCVIFFRENEHVLLWSVSVGTGVAFFLLLFFTWRYILPLGHPFSPAVRRSLYLAPGLLILQASQYIFVLTDKVFVSFLPQGDMSALAYALTLVSLLPTILNFNGSFITVIAEQNELDKKAEIFNDLISMVIYIGFGVTAFMLMAGQSIVQLVLEHGAFTEDNTVSVARAISAYAWMIVPIFLISLLDQVFQVEQRIGFMVRRTVLGLLTNAFLSALFLFGMGWGLFGVALATSISYWVMLLSGLAGLKNVGYPLEKRKHLRWGAWNAPALLLAYIVFASLPAPFNSSLGGVSAAIFLVGGAMLLAGLSWRGREQQLIISTVRRCLPRKS